MASVKIIRKVTVVNKLGLHARASAELVKLAGQYSSSVELAYGNQSADGKNIMGLMMLAATYGSEINITTMGHDAQRAADAICDLFSKRLGEKE